MTSSQQPRSTHPAPHAPTHPAIRATHAISITDQLDREWATLRGRPQSIRRARSWAVHLDPSSATILGAVSSLDELIAATHANQGAAGERLLRALVKLAPDDQLAGRVVVQRLLPGVLAASARYGRLCEHHDPIAEAMGALWISIASFDGERRKGPVAASIISDTMFAAFRRRLRNKSADEQPTEPTTFDDRAAAAAPCPFVELASVVRDARLGGAPADDLDLLRHLVRAESTQRVADELKVTPRTIRNHRARAISRVRNAIAA